MYPKAEFIITGVLGPNANAHGPNEFLHIPFTKKLICCLIDICANIKLRKWWNINILILNVQNIRNLCNSHLINQCNRCRS